MRYRPCVFFVSLPPVTRRRSPALMPPIVAPTLTIAGESASAVSFAVLRERRRNLLERTDDARQPRDRLIRRVGNAADVRQRLATRVAERGDLLVDAVQSDVPAVRNVRASASIAMKMPKPG